MAADGKDRILVASDILYFVTFATGMAAFWIGGQASAHLPAQKAPGLHLILSLVVSGGVFGLGMLILSSFVFRRLGKSALIASVTAIILGLAAAQIVVRLAAGHVHSATSLGILTFVLYLIYGTIYALSLSIGRRFAKP